MKLWWDSSGADSFAFAAFLAMILSNMIVIFGAGICIVAFAVNEPNKWNFVYGTLVFAIPLTLYGLGLFKGFVSKTIVAGRKELMS